MKAKQLPSGKWRARAYNKFTQTTKSFTADTAREAERLAIAYEFRESVNGGRRFGEAAELYINSKKAVLSPNTIRDYRNSLDNHLAEIKERRIDKVSDITIQVIVNDLAERLSPKSVKNVYGFITAVLRNAGIKREFNVTLPMREKKEINIPSEEEMKIILNEIKGTVLDVPVRMALNLCMRRGEICAVLAHKECVTKDSVIVKYNMIRNGDKWVIKSPKTYYSYRTIPCSHKLAKEIKETPEVNPGILTDKWIKLMKKLGMKYRFHDIRHESASMMLSLGIPSVDVEKIGGWRHGSSVLQSVYTHTMDESLKKSAEKWQKKMEQF